MPRVRNVRRGSAAGALRAFRAEGAEALVQELLADRIAKSGVASAASLLTTWTHFHVTVFASELPPIPVLPVTPRSLVLIGSVFKRGGYRSFANYLTAIRAAHIEAEFDWGQLLSHTGTWVSRSVLRGIGPARQSCGFLFGKLRKLPRTFDPLCENGPHDPIRLTLLSILFLLREIEVSTSRVSAWSFDHEAQEVTWHLPSSKTDHMALGSNAPGHVFASFPAWSVLTTCASSI